MPSRRVYATQQQAAKRFGTTDRTIRNWINEGKITGYRLPSGRAIRVDLEEIEALIKAVPAVMQPQPPKPVKQPPKPKRRAFPNGRIVTVVEEYRPEADGGSER
jgi:excisionase family DNA binding protein